MVLLHVGVSVKEENSRLVFFNLIRQIEEGNLMIRMDSLTPVYDIFLDEMQTQISGIFGSYDLFAKAFPGTVFLLCAISLLPQEAFDFDLAQSGALVASLTILVLVLGFVFGQALHSISVWVEKKFYSISRRWFEISVSIQNWYYGYYANMMNELGYGMERSRRTVLISDIITFILTVIILVISITIITNSEPTTTQTRSFLIGISIGILSFWVIYYSVFVNRVRNWVSQTLIPHRRQFGAELSGSEVRNKAEMWLPMSFIETVDEKYDTDNGTMDGSAVDLLYTLVMSYLAHSNIGRARQFQAVFAFCRSMWVTLFLYSICYMMVGLRYTTWNIPFISQTWLEQTISYQPIIFSQVAGANPLIAVGFSMFMSGFFFMEGERQYKSLFIDYVMADFITLTDR